MRLPSLRLCQLLSLHPRPQQNLHPRPCPLQNPHLHLRPLQNLRLSRRNRGFTA